MSKEILVNVGERENRIAVLEDGKLVELHIEREERVVGGLYKARVCNVLPGMDAAFVDVGLERNAFLYVGDVLPVSDGETESAPSVEVEAGERGGRRGRGFRRRRGDEDAATASSGLPPGESVSVEAGEEAAEVVADDVADLLAAHGVLDEVEDALEDETDDDPDEDDAAPELHAEAEPAAIGEPSSGGRRLPSRRPVRSIRRSALRLQKIKDVLKVGQEILVQVIKGPRGTKGARVSTRISLPGRYLVLMPEADNVGVSRKIEDGKERDRLKKIGEKLREPGFGIIIRTEAEEKTEHELKADKDFLIKLWRQIQETSRKVQAPALIHQDLTLVYKTIRDVFGSDVSRLVIDDPAEFEKANELLDMVSPRLRGRIHLYTGDKPLFEHHKIEEEIDRLLKRKVWLRSGGYLIFDETEALTVVDVNTGKYTGGGSLAETIVKTNIDAAAEIARQLRLRDIGGIIVIDFIDMNNPRDKQQVIRSLENALKRDRSRTKISSISSLGLVEMTRKRTGETMTDFLTEPCEYCGGRGKLPSAESVSIVAERELTRVARSGKKEGEAILIQCHPDVAELLIGAGGDTIDRIEREVQRAILVRALSGQHLERFEITSGELAELERRYGSHRRQQVVECVVARSLIQTDPSAVGWADGYPVYLEHVRKFLGQQVKAKVTSARRSFASGTVIPGTNRPVDRNDPV